MLGIKFLFNILYYNKKDFYFYPFYASILIFRYLGINLLVETNFNFFISYNDY